MDICSLPDTSIQREDPPPGHAGTAGSESTTLSDWPPSSWEYPAITACLRDARLPIRAEIRMVASRIWRECLAPRFGVNRADFGARRILLRATMAALTGSGDSRTTCGAHVRGAFNA